MAIEIGPAEVRHRVVIVGAGSIGERHVRCFIATDRTEVSFVETGDARRDEVAARCPAARAFASLDAALAWPFDVAVVATPAVLHVPIAERLVSEGKHVLIEKPLAASAEGVDHLADSVRRAGVMAGVAYVYRAHPALADMAAAIASGRIGTPVQLIAVSGQHFPTYRPAYQQTYYASHATGGGAVQDALTHLFNAGEWLVGPIDRVAADAAHQVLEGVEVEDTVNVLARHGGVLGCYSLNQYQAPNELAITVVGQHGTARFEYHACRWRLASRPEEPWQDFNFGPLDRDAIFVRQANAFLDAVEGKTKPACSLAEATNTLHVNLAVLAAARDCSWRDVPNSTVRSR